MEARYMKTILLLILIFNTDVRSNEKIELLLPKAGNCNDDVVLVCHVLSGNVSTSRIWERPNRTSIVVNGIAANSDKYSEQRGSTSFNLTIKQFSNVDKGEYRCSNGFDRSYWMNLPFECKAKTAVVSIDQFKHFIAVIDKIYPAITQQNSINVSATINGQISVTIFGSIQSVSTHSQNSSLYDVKWESNSSLTGNGNYSYSITVKTVTTADPITGRLQIVAPSIPVIENTVSVNGRTVVWVRQQENTQLRCVSVGGYPRTNLVLLKGSSNSPVGESSFILETDKNTYKVTNQYIFIPTREDDLATFTCRSYYNVSEDTPLDSTAQLYLKLKPVYPSVSQIGTITAGNNASIRCETSQARPAANISWFYRGQMSLPTVTTETDQTTETFTSVSTFSRAVRRDDNTQLLKCIISHETLQSPLTSTATVSVRFPPLTASLTGSQQIVADGQNILNLKCTTGTAYPLANVTWHNGTIEITTGVSQTNIAGNYGGRVTEGRLQLKPTRHMDGDVISCSAANSVNQGNPVKMETSLDLQYSPLVMISETSPKTVIEGDSDVVIHCSANSKPSSTFTWYHNNKPLTSGTVQTERTSSYTITTVNRIQYGNYQCKANNTILPVGQASLSLQIKFMPLTVSITGNQNIEANDNNKLNLVCETDTSNPVANIVWNNGSTVITNVSPVTETDGRYGGKIMSQTLTFVPTRYMDGASIVCEGSNYLSGSSPARASAVLNLAYYPISTAVDGPVKNVTEGQPDVSLTCVADSKPVATFEWKKDSTPVKTGSGTSSNNRLTYTIDVVGREHAGDYSCTADNGIGTPDNSNGLVTLVVQYPPAITLITTNTTVNASNIEIICSASGVPTTYTFSPWKHSWAVPNEVIRAHLPYEITEKPHGQILRLTSLSYQDTGIYTCGANNGVTLWGTEILEMVNSVYLVVKSYPVITLPDVKNKDAFKITPRLNQPFTVNISFYSNADQLKANLYRERNATMESNSTKDLVTNSTIHINESVVDLPVYGKSVPTAGYLLTLSHKLVNSNDFGMYFLEITNAVGSAEFLINTSPESPPCTPKSPAIYDYLETAITVSWIRCYHGGFAQTFVIQYREDGNVWTNGSSKEGGLSTSNKRINSTVEGLKPATKYYIQMYAYNSHGRSGVTETLNITTKMKPDEKKTSSNVGLIVGGAVGGVALAAVIIVVVLLIIRRRKDFTKSPRNGLLKDNADRPNVIQSNDDTPEINLNPMYESAGPLPSTSNNSDVYSQVDKTKKQTKAAGDIYSQVNKVKKQPKASGSQNKNDVYAQVLKTNKKENATGKVKQKKQKPDKKSKQGKNTAGMIYDNVDTVNSAGTEADNVYENPSCSTEDEKPKQIRNQDGLIYVELDLPKQTAGKDRKAVIHGLDNSTDYADIKFGEVGQQAPESDEEDNKKEG